MNKKNKKELDIDSINIIDLMIQDIKYQLLHVKKVTGRTLQNVASEDFKKGLELAFIKCIIKSTCLEEGSIYGKTLSDKIAQKEKIDDKLEIIAHCSELDPILKNTIFQAILVFYISTCIRFGITPDQIYISQLSILSYNQ